VKFPARTALLGLALALAVCSQVPAAEFKH
jgi:hypothetical protein